MKKLFTFALALCTLSVFAQTNLFTPVEILKTYGANGNPFATINGTEIKVEIVGDGNGQWQNQIHIVHTVEFDAAKWYQVTMTFEADADCGGTTIKMDDNAATVWEDQKVNIVAGTPYNYDSKAVAGVAGNNKDLVIDFGYAKTGTHITIKNIVVKEVEAPEIDLCDATKTATAFSNPQTAALSCDGNLGTRWASRDSDGDSVVWQRNYETVQTFNRVKFVWEGAYAIAYDIYAGNDCENMTKIAEVRDVDPKGQFPYTIITELSESVSAKHVRFQGVKKATGYGYSFWEMEVFEAEVSVLTSLDFTAAAMFAKVDNTVNLTATPKDQYGVAMADQVVTYAVEPANAGHVTDGVYTADAAGAATITATCGTLSKNVTIYNYAGENLVLSTNIDTDNKIIDQSGDKEGAHNAFFAVDVNEASIWAAMEGDNVARDSVCWFVADLGALYDLELAAVKFEGASSKAYTLEASVDNDNWTVIAEGTTPGMANVTNIHDMSAAQGVRYVKYHSTENATQYGHKIFDFKVFGVTHTATALPAAAINGKAVKLIENGNIVIIRDGVRYNAQGAKL